MNTLTRVFWYIALMATMTNCGAAGERNIKFATISLEENYPDSKQTRSLIKQACNGDRSGVDASLREGALLDGPGKRNIPPLFWAIANGCKEGVRLLIGAGANVNVRMQDDATPVWFAASEADESTLSILLEAGGDPNHVARDSSPLLEAAGAGRWDNMRLLVSHGADVNWMAKRGATVASYAASSGQFSQVLFLLDSGYRTDLGGIVWTAKNRVLPKESEQQAYREQVLLKLRELGAVQ